MSPINRIHSRSLSHMREDLAASIALVLPIEESAHLFTVVRMIEDFDAPEQGQTALRCVRDQLGAEAFGLVTLFHIQAGTSLSGDAEVVTSPESLSAMELAVEDLRWPASALHPLYATSAAADDPASEVHMSMAVDAWRSAIAAQVPRMRYDA